VIGTYMHGLFDTPAITRHWLTGIGLDTVVVDELHGPAARDQAYELLAEHATRHLDIRAITALLPQDPAEEMSDDPGTWREYLCRGRAVGLPAGRNR
jgi:adenosylcobyric acid synthase